MYNNQTEMKKFITKATALLSLFAVAACSEDALVENVPVAGTTVKEISITGKGFDFESATRSSVSITESGADFIWSENDTVGIFPNTSSQAEFAMSQGAGTETATFTGGGWALKSSATYAAYYPYNFYNRDLKNIPVSYEGQTQNGNVSIAHIGAYDFMAASVSTPENGAVSFDMQHLGCLVQLTVDLDEAATINEVSIKYGEENSGEFITNGYIDLSSLTPAIQASSQEDKSNTISIVLENLTVTADETATIYFMMAPVNLDGKTIDVTVTKNDDEAKKYQVAGKNYIAGKAYAIALSSSDEVATQTSYTMVDLGLPSGTLWADRNVGADSPEAYGDYFAWGETTPKDYYDWSTYKWCQGSSNTLTKYCADSSCGTVDNKIVLDLEDDAAYVNMGEEWRMPTYDELNELINKCSWTWTTQNGTNGYTVTGPNGNSIFLPAAGRRYEGDFNCVGIEGYYNSAMREDGDYAWYLEFGKMESNYFRLDDGSRSHGRTVRAVTSVKKEPAPKVNKVDLGLTSGTLWADRNVGADSPEAYGDYFAWGETTTKSTYDWSTYKWCQGLETTMTKYCTDSSYGTVDNKTSLEQEDDAAYVNMGTEWRMPTKEEQDELNSECTWMWTLQNEVYGYKVTGPNGKSIFLPATGLRMGSDLRGVGSNGYFCSSSLSVGSPSHALFLYFGSSYHYYFDDCRCYGHTVRPVVR